MINNYGSTPITYDELDCLLLPGATIETTKEDVYFAELSKEKLVKQEYLEKIRSGEILVEKLIDPYFILDLHTNMYSEIWTWAGKLRRTTMNIGVDPTLIRQELKYSSDNLLYMYENNKEYKGPLLGLAAHAEFVRIHPFVDGNGRSTRVLADLINVSLGLEEYNWDIDKKRYIEILRIYNDNFDPRPLKEFIWG